jgi:hypothetical protein
VHRSNFGLAESGRDELLDRANGHIYSAIAFAGADRHSAERRERWFATISISSADSLFKEQDMTADEAAKDKTGFASGGSDEPQIEIVADEDWKSRVQAENAALDQKFRTAGPSTAKTETPETAQAEVDAEQATPERGQLPPLPDASLASLLAMLSNQAMVALGLIRNPVTGKAEKELTLARYFIDLIAVLEEKTKGNLDPDEAAALDETLHTLRMAYVHRLKETA